MAEKDLTDQLLNHGGDLGDEADGYGIRSLRAIKDSWWHSPKSLAPQPWPTAVDEKTVDGSGLETSRATTEKSIADMRPESDEAILGYQRAAKEFRPAFGVETPKTRLADDAKKIVAGEITPELYGASLNRLAYWAQSGIMGMGRIVDGAILAVNPNYRIGDSRAVADLGAGESVRVGRGIPYRSTEPMVDDPGYKLADKSRVEREHFAKEADTLGEIFYTVTPYVITGLFGAKVAASLGLTSATPQIMAAILSDAFTGFAEPPGTDTKGDPANVTIFNVLDDLMGADRDQQSLVEKAIGWFAINRTDTDIEKRVKRAVGEGAASAIVLGMFQGAVKGVGAAARTANYVTALSEVADASSRLNIERSVQAFRNTNALIEHSIEMGQRRWGSRFLDDVYDRVHAPDLSSPRGHAVMNVRASLKAQDATTALLEAKAIQKAMQGQTTEHVRTQLNVLYPDTLRVVGDPRAAHPIYRSYLEIPEGDVIGKAAKFSPEEIDEAWKAALAMSPPQVQAVIQRLAHQGDGKGINVGPVHDVWTKIGDAPMAWRFWYERGNESFGKKIAPDVSPRHVMLMHDLIGTTSPKTPVETNLLRALAALSQHVQGKPVTMDYLDPSAISGSFKRAEGEATSLGFGIKTENFTNTSALLAGVSDAKPLPVNDVMMMGAFGSKKIADDSQADLLHVPFSLFQQNLRDLANSRLAPGDVPFQHWQIQAPAWAIVRSEGLPAGATKEMQQGDFAGVMDKITELVRSNGLPLDAEGRISMATLMDERFPGLLRTSIDDYDRSLKATIEFKSDESEIGQQAALINMRAIEAGDQKVAREFAALQAKSMYNWRRSEHSLNDIVGAVVGTDVKLARIESPPGHSPFDISGTYEGTLTPNIVVPMMFADKQVKSTFLLNDELAGDILALVGHQRGQAAMAASSWRDVPADGKLFNGEELTWSVFTPTAKELSREQIATLKGAIGAHEVTVWRRPNGYHFIIHPAYGDAGRTMPSEALAHAAGDALGLPFEALQHVYRSVYRDNLQNPETMKGVMDKLKQRMLSDVAAKHAPEGTDPATAARLIQEGDGGVRPERWVGEARAEYGERTAALDAATAKARAEHQEYEAGLEKFVQKYGQEEGTKRRALSAKGAEEASDVQKIEWQPDNDPSFPRIHRGFAIDHDTGREVAVTISEKKDGTAVILSGGELFRDVVFPNIESARRLGEQWLQSTYPGAFRSTRAIRSQLEQDAALAADVPSSRAGTGRAAPGTTTPEGLKLTAPIVVGKRAPNGRDVALNSEQIANVALYLFGGNVQLGRPKNAAGMVTSLDTGPGGRAVAQQLVMHMETSRNLDRFEPGDIAKLIKADQEFRKTFTHELGHGFDNLALTRKLFDLSPTIIPDEAKELLRADLHRVSFERRPDLWRANDDKTAMEGFAADAKAIKEYRERPDELFADAISMYLTDPAWMKKHAPTAAMFIRTLVNQDPQIAKVIQFNEGAAGIIALGLATGAIKLEDAKGGGFDPEGSGYDYDGAAGMERDENGHMGSVRAATPDEIAKHGLPAESYLMLKGRGHETWAKAIQAESERGFVVVKRGQRYWSVPKNRGN